MKKSKISILLLLIVMILAISAVSAADIDDTSDAVVQAVDEAPVEEVASEDVDAVAATDDTDVLTVADKNFTQLQAEIEQSSTGMITLQSNYIRAEGESDIEINKNFNIFGNDAYTIDARNLGGIFKINQGCSVLLSNVILINGNGNNGGAIYNEGTVNIISSTLTDNNATFGGAVYNTGIATLSGSTLNGNTATNGGAIYSTGTLVLSDGNNFNENTATYRGGAVYNEGTLEATNSVFDGNDITFRSANDDNGGAAIYNLGGVVNLDGAKVINNLKNIVYREGNSGDYINAAIVTKGRLYITNSYIANNSGSWGGGVYVTGDETFTVTNTAFENNVATFGAAIYDEGSPIIVENCNFTNNHCEGVGSPGTANTQAAAILVMAEGSSAIITGSRFNKNVAKVGGAISISEASGDIYVGDCEFVENSAYSEGGAIYNYAAEGATLTLKDSKFVDNVAPFGSAISNDADLNLSGNTIIGGSTAPIANYFGTIESELFVNILEGQTVVTILPTNVITAYITDDNGNAIIDKKLVLLIDGNEVATAYNKTTGAHTATYTFTNPGSYEVTAEDYDATHTTPATIVFESPLSSLQALIDANTNGTLDLTYGFTYLENHDSAIKDTGVLISKDITLNGNGVTIDGANVSRLFTVADGVTLTLNNMIITNGAAEKGAGVYVNSGAELMANSVNFINNTAVKRGGAIYSEGTVTVDNCVFDSNDITFRTANDDNGGAAIYNLKGDLTIKNTNITNNLKDIVIRNGNAGDLLDGVVITTGETLITDSYFANNTGSWGGAISSLGYMNTNPYTLTVKNSKFEGNNATFGGAIFVESSDLEVENCTFENNKGVGVGSSGTSNTQGGAIVVHPAGSSATITDSTFIANSANTGGAVSLAGVDEDSLIDNCTFTDNTASDGGAVYLWTQGDAAVTVENSKFEGNTAGWGNSISTDGALKLSNNTMPSNSAEIGNWAGSIESETFVTILDGQTIVTASSPYTITAIVTDDKGNKIIDHNLVFLVGDVQVPTTNNRTTGIHTGIYTFTAPGTYLVTTTDAYDAEHVTNATLIYTFATYTELQNLIDNAEAGATINLDHSITYDATFDGEEFINGILISKDIVIAGADGVQICGNDLARIFNVTNATLTLNNVIICDGKADKGAGVYVNEDASLIADDVSFVENTAVYRGGAIYSEGTVIVENSVFDSNDITFRTKNDDNGGAAIYNLKGILLIEDTNITNNLKDIVIRDGNNGDLLVGVVVTSGNTVIDNTYFANNTGSWGGAISSLGYMNDEPYTLTVLNSKFEGNNATFGGAIFVESSKLVIDNSTFINNKGVGVGSSGTSNTQGGAIVVFPQGASAEITDSTFTGNSANIGGAVSLAGVDGNSLIDNSTFTDNEASSEGGAVYLWTQGDATVAVEDSKFEGNTAPWGNAISNDGVLSLSNNTIVGTGTDIANYYGEIVSTIFIEIMKNGTYSYHMEDIILNATITDDNGNLINDINFVFTIGDIGEVNAGFVDGIYTAVYTPTVPGTYVVNISYPDENNLIVNTSTITIYRTLTDLANLIENADQGSTIVLNGDYTYTPEFDSAIVNGIVIDKNIIIDGNGSTISGANLARLFNVTAVNILTLANVTVRDAKADKGAGVYVNKGAGLATINVNFINNTAVYRGGAIYSEGSVMVTNSVFDSNDITFRTVNDDNGGAAIYNLNGTLGIYNSNITNNLKNITIRSGNAGDLLVGVVVTSGTTDIRDSYFANNTGSWGGAISSLGYMNTEDYTLTVKNTKFEGNNATFGGAIFVESSNLVIDNSTFENNRGVGVGSSGTSNTQGGAIVVHPAGSSATITDSTFIANSANIGGAVSLAGVDGNSLIDNCTFTDNEASSEGGAVYLWTQEDATIAVEDSKFEGNTAPWGSAISNDGKLSLSNNTIVGTGDAIGNYYGVISSKIIITFLGNQTVPAEMGDIFILNATFTDDNGNIIDDPYFKFSVNGETIEDISYNETTGLYTAPYYIATSGPKVISTNYDAGEIEKLIGILDVPKANVTEFYVGTGTATKIPYGENVTIFVGLYGVNSEGLNKTIKVVVNNTEYTVTLTDGEGSFNVSGLAPGEYAAFAIFDGDDNYNGAYDTGLFNVLYPDAILSVVTQDITYGEDAVINISLTDADGTPLQGTLTIVVNDFVKMIDWTGENSISVPNLGANETGWRVLVSFAGDDLHTNVWNDTEIVKVAKATPGIDIIGPFDINVTENAEFSVTVDADVDSIALNIWIDGKEFEVIGPAEWNSNVAEFIIPASMLNEARDYNITVQYIGNDNYTASENASQILTVNKIDISNLIQIEGSTVTYGANGTVTFKLPDDAEGTVTVILDGVDGIFTAEVVGGEAIVEIPNLDAGTYQLMDANYTGDNKYANWTHAGHLPEIEVKQANSQVIVTAFRFNDTYPGEVKVLYEIFNATSFKILVIDANSSVIYNETVVASEKIVEDIFTLKDLAAGIYAVIIENNETQNYAGSLGTSSFIIEKAVPVFTSVASEGAKVGDNVTITVTAPKDATGMVYLSVDGELIGNLTLEDGTAVFNVTDLDAGHHSYEVSYEGDANYTIASDFNSFDVAKADVTVTITINETQIDLSGDLDVNVTVSGDATGYIKIDVNGIISVEELKDGNYSFTITDLAAGENTIEVTYLGDNNHNKANNTRKFTVPKKVPGIDLIGPDEITIGENAEFTVYIDAKADVYALNIWIDGKEFEAIGPAEWNSNVAEFIIPASMLNEARDYNITVQYIGNDNYTASENASQILTVNKIDISNLIQIEGSTVTYGENGTVTFELPMDAEGTVTVILDGVDGIFTAEVAGGEAIVQIPGLNVGTYALIDANYTGDGKYANWTPNAQLPEIEVKQAKSMVVIASLMVNDTYPGEVYVGYYILNATTFKVLVLDENLSAIYNETVVASEKRVIDSFAVKGLAAGNYFVVIINNRTQNYDSDMDQAEFTIQKAVPVFTSVASEGAKVGDNVTITVTAPKDATGMVYLSVDGELIGNLTLEDGTAVFNVSGLDAGHHSYEVSYEGDANYTIASDFNSFDVAKADVTVTITIEESQIGVMGSPDVNVTVSGNATGYIKIDVNGIISVEELKDGNYTFQITDLTAGDYTVEVTYLGDDNYNKANETKTFTVPKSSPEIDAQVVASEITYGEDAEIIIDMNPDGAYGNVTIFVDNKEYATVVLDNDYANATAIISDLGVGTHNITITYNGNDNYNSITKAITNAIEVKQATSKVTIDPITNVTVGQSVVISYAVENETEVTIVIKNEGGAEQAYDIIDGKIVLSVEAGKYTVNITNAGNENVTGSSAIAAFEVAQNPEFDFNITFPENSTDSVFTITVPEDAVGYLLVDIDGQHYYAPVENGTASVTVPGLAPGNYTAAVTYTGDDKYPSSTVTKEVAVPSNLPEDALTIPETADTESPLTYSVNLPADATGYLIVDVDGTKYVAALENGSASITVPALSEGDHNVTVSYTGDSKYSSASKSSTLAVKKPVYKITNNKNVAAIYSAKAYYKVLVTKDGKAVGAGEKVTIKYNGKTYTVKTDSKGYATLKLDTNVKVKKYTITAEYKGVKVTNKVTIKHVIKAKNKKAKKSKKLKLKIKLKKVDGKYLVGKKLKLKFKGKTYKAKTNAKGKAKFTIKKKVMKKLKKGKKYKYKVTYGKDKVTKKIKVKK